LLWINKECYPAYGLAAPAAEQHGTTKVGITIYNESLARLEKMIEMGTLEGCAMQFKNLEELLATLSQK
jgi:hypothetical protein